MKGFFIKEFSCGITNIITLLLGIIGIILTAIWPSDIFVVTATLCVVAFYPIFNYMNDLENDSGRFFAMLPVRMTKVIDVKFILALLLPVIPMLINLFIFIMRCMFDSELIAIAAEVVVKELTGYSLTLIMAAIILKLIYYSDRSLLLNNTEKLLFSLAYIAVVGAFIFLLSMLFLFNGIIGHKLNSILSFIVMLVALPLYGILWYSEHVAYEKKYNEVSVTEE